MLDFVPYELTAPRSCSQLNKDMKEDALPDDGQKKKKENEKSGGRSQHTSPGTASALHTQSKVAAKVSRLRSIVSGFAAKPDNKQCSGNFPCIFCCKDDHRSAACPMNLEQRMAAFKAKGWCCSKRSHRQSDYTENRKCVQRQATTCSSAFRTPPRNPKY